jgi:glycosyltransferase involved in cell wall biosynthesis
MDKKKKIAIVGTNGIPAKYGGFETFAENITKHLNDKFDFIVYCSNKQKTGLKEYNNSTLINLPLNANGWQSIIYDTVSLLHAAIKSDVILYLGPGAGFILPLIKLSRKKIIVNHGGLNEWERKKLSEIQKKYTFWSYNISAKFADSNIADNQPLVLSLKKAFNVNAEKIEYGGDHVLILPIEEKYINVFPFLNLQYDLSVSRAQPDNNLHLLLEAYENIQNRNLVLISNWNVSEYGQKLKAKYINKYSNIFIVDAVYNQEYLNVIRSNTSLYIHSHSQCGTAPSLVEAMNYNIPIICYDVPTNRGTTFESTLYFKDVDSLSRIITDLSDEKLNEIKTELYHIAKNNYTWDIICGKYSKLFQK